MKPVLCSPIDFDTLLKLVTDDNWVFQQKLDGKRLLVDINDGKVTGYSRKGERTDVPRAVASALSQTLSEGHFVLDGELMGPMFNIFDVPVAGDLIHKDTSYELRRTALCHLKDLRGWFGPLAILRTAVKTEAKADLVRKVIEAGSEGIIARHMDGLYDAGKRSASVVKWKLQRTIDCVVREGEPGKQHFNLELLDGTHWVPVGAISALTGDGPRVKVGDVVEVTYMGASSDGRLIQPVKPMLRTDKDPRECRVDQLFYVNREVLG